MEFEDELRYTKSYIPKISNDSYIPNYLKPIIQNLECRAIHEGRLVKPELHNESYVLYDRVMNPLAAQLERKPRRDRGTRRGLHSTSSSSAFDQPSSSHLNDDDDDGNDEWPSRASTPSPIRYVNS
ncbi:hypothetical protein Tco_0143076, partial [Tanacetum coccineum]